jgi:hypothetical protein
MNGQASNFELASNDVRNVDAENAEFLAGKTNFPDELFQSSFIYSLAC